MTSITLLLALATLGVEVGYEPASDGSMQYVVHIDPSTKNALTPGEPVDALIPPEVRNLPPGRIRVVFDNSPVPHTKPKRIETTYGSEAITNASNVTTTGGADVPLRGPGATDLAAGDTGGDRRHRGHTGDGGAPGASTGASPGAGGMGPGGSVGNPAGATAPTSTGMAPGPNLGPNSVNTQSGPYAPVVGNGMPGMSAGGNPQPNYGAPGPNSLPNNMQPNSMQPNNGQPNNGVVNYGPAMTAGGNPNPNGMSPNNMGPSNMGPNPAFNGGSPNYNTANFGPANNGQNGGPNNAASGYNGVPNPNAIGNREQAEANNNWPDDRGETQKPSTPFGSDKLWFIYLLVTGGLLFSNGYLAYMFWDARQRYFAMLSRAFASSPNILGNDPSNPIQ